MVKKSARRTRRTHTPAFKARVYLIAYDSVGAARSSIAQYFDWYNTERLRRMKILVRPELPIVDNSAPFAIRPEST